MVRRRARPLIPSKPFAVVSCCRLKEREERRPALASVRKENGGVSLPTCNPPPLVKSADWAGPCRWGHLFCECASGTACCCPPPPRPTTPPPHLRLSSASRRQRRAPTVWICLSSIIQGFPASHFTLTGTVGVPAAYYSCLCVHLTRIINRISYGDTGEGSCSIAE